MPRPAYNRIARSQPTIRPAIFTCVLLPLFLIVLATVAAAMMAYGTHPDLAQYANGLEMIMLTRRLQWPLIATSLILCLALLGLVISNKRRAWWLIGLAPVLALFVHRFAPPLNTRLYIGEFTEADPQWRPADEAWIVGLVFQEQAYALPYSVLYRTPIIFITDYDKRLVVLWSATANRALAFQIARDFKPRDLEIVSAPADTLLLHDTRLGTFILSVTGKTPDGKQPVEFNQPIPTFKMTWSAWQKSHPQTQVLRGYESPDAPAAPLLPRVANLSIDGLPAEKRVTLIATTQPIAIDGQTVTTKLANATIGPLHVLLFRDPATQQLRAFNRNPKEDLFLTLRAARSSKFPEAVFSDANSNSFWTPDGKAIDGPLKGLQMKELHIEDDLYWGVMKKWYPELALTKIQ